MATIAEHITYLAPSLARKKHVPAWPPDVFAISGSLLIATGAYCTGAAKWPPTARADEWTKQIRRIGKRWRKGFEKRAPGEVQKWWAQLQEKRHLELKDVTTDVRLCHALMQLFAAADETSAGAGIPSDSTLLDDFDLAANYVLSITNKGTSLCKDISCSTLRVLPKTHAPQSGLTIRSFSHHLAIVEGGEITPFWRTISATSDEPTFNLLVIPWPPKVKSEQFHPVKKNKSRMRNLPNSYRFFDYEIRNPANLPNYVLATLQRASRSATIDAIVMPEASLTDAEYDAINSFLLPKGIFLIAGVGGRDSTGENVNCVRYNIPVQSHQVPVRQAKHHRWKIDASQIRTYHLSPPLNEKRSWWENIPLGDRSLTFVSLRPWLTMCALICEDLARPDPIGNLIRAVGPNLVIALLLDGPQIQGRWPELHATTLADDPGSSVLTLTSSGMSQRSKPPWLRGASDNANKVALWKDVRHRPVSVDLESDGEAAILHLEVEEREEWTADGRTDNRSTGYPILKKVTIMGKRLRHIDVS